jgi:XTP/dITP diphosphohydrolase
MPKEIVIATGNRGKLREFQELMADLPISWKMLSDFPAITEVEETGQTFAENAILKASEYARQTGLWTLADDSGLAVEALDGAPGVFSARFGGADTTHAQKIEKLLQKLENSGLENRNAQFVCVIALANESGEIVHQTTGICQGIIARQSKGSGGFGYDPIFVPNGYTETFGQLDVRIKHQISHRARAAAEMRFFFKNFLKLK